MTGYQDNSPSRPMGLFPDTQICWLRMCWECRERFPRHHGLAVPTCITARAWCMPGSLTSGFLWNLWRGGKRCKDHGIQRIDVTIWWWLIMDEWYHKAMSWHSTTHKGQRNHILSSSHPSGWYTIKGQMNHILSSNHPSGLCTIKLTSVVDNRIFHKTGSITWLLMTWQHKEPGHQQLW